MSRATLIIVSAPSGAGKTSLVNALQDNLDDLKVSISHTTRLPRPGEVDGTDYHFVSTTEFEEIKNSNGFLESARVFDRYYGTARSTVDDSLSQGVDVILEIDWQGAQQVRNQYQDCISIFILPPSLAILEQRLRQRAQDDDETIARRMQDALSEISHYTEYDYLILNDDFEETLEKFKNIVTSTRQLTRRQKLQQQSILANLLNHPKSVDK
ncbi:MAG TPA: guanylate kinase [Crenotrichaceae bacterium]|nr:guanylate kinase [Crenotrichaceae bacterium]